jgi:hypothetical protein
VAARKTKSRGHERGYFPARSCDVGSVDQRSPSVANLCRADALEDAGCTDADLLGHLHGPWPHVRGCWAVDLVLGKV